MRAWAKFWALWELSFCPSGRDAAESQSGLEKALSLDENLAEAHAAAGMLAHWLEWDWEAAGRSFDRALALNPGDAMTHANHGWFMVTMKRPDEAVREIKKAQELDPLMPLYYAWSVSIHNNAERLTRLSRNSPGHGDRSEQRPGLLSRPFRLYGKGAL
jgi:tetratricopeptide (TPR) repeat protein